MTKHVTVYQDANRYAGWPANYGIWAWGNEIVVCFIAGYNDPRGAFHTRDKSRPFETIQARSLDGGVTWQTERFPGRTPGGRALSGDEHVNRELSLALALEQGAENAPQPCPGGIDFTHPDFALMCARTGLGSGTVAWFYTSYDRCHTWNGPFSLPMFDQPGIEARTDYLVSDRQTCLLFLTAAGAQGSEGHGVFCARTEDGGKTFQFAGWVTRVQDGFAIMPSSVRLSPSHIVTAVRCRNRTGISLERRDWIDVFESRDNGVSWRHLSRPALYTGYGGNPPALLKLRDGRLCLIYGYRAEPFGIRAVLSNDGGATWGETIVLRSDGGNHDLGYPRAVQRPDGTVVAVYYYNDDPQGERYIAATLWTP